MELPTKEQINKSLEQGGNILDSKLQGYSTLEGVIGPECYSGGFCLVYPVVKGNEKYAFRVWHTEIADIKNRLKQISNYLASHPLPYFVDFEYVDNALRVLDEEGNEQKIDAVRMEWVEGKNLVEYIDSIISDGTKTDETKRNKLCKLASDFKDMVIHLHREEIAHGDLQHGNIIIDASDRIKLVDYDSVYVPTFNGEKQVTSGLAAYQHPSRKGNNLITSKTDDYFSEQIIYLSILCFAEDLTLWQPLGERDEYSLLFTETDYGSILSSPIYKKCTQIKNVEISSLLEELKKNLAFHNTDQIRPLEDVIINKYASSPEERVLTDGELSNLVPKESRQVYKPIPVQTPDFDEVAARNRYGQN